jgi:hypothetical protein
MVSIRPHNITNPVCVDDPCYRCEGRWKLMRLTLADRERMEELGVHLVAKCTRCGIVSAATRRPSVAVAPSIDASV